MMSRQVVKMASAATFLLRCFTFALLVLTLSPASAAGTPVTLADPVGNYTGTATNPLIVSTGAGGTTTANQGTAGASPWPVLVAQYNATLPTLASGTSSYVQVDASGRLILAPASSITISNFPATQAVSNAGTFAVQQTAATPAGSNLIGKVGIDQTTPGTTNKVSLGSDIINALISGGSIAYYDGGSLPSVGTGFNPPRVDLRGQLKVSETGSSDPLTGIAPTALNAVTASVLKSSPGNLFGVYATNFTTTTGYLITINATAAPTSGATIAAVECLPLAASGYTPLNYGSGPGDGYTTGIVALVSTSCTTYTPSTLSAFIHGRVR